MRGADGIGLLPPAAGGVAAQLVGEATRRHRHQPRPGILRPPLHRPLGRGRLERLLDGVLAGVEVAVAAHQRTKHLGDQPPDGPPVAHGSTLASYMIGRTSTPQWRAAGVRAAISRARSRLSQSTIVKLPRYSLASA